MTGKISLYTTVEVCDSIISTSVDDEEILLDLDTDLYYSMNPTGREIYMHLQEPVQVGELRELLVDNHDVSTEQAKTDLLEYLELLAEEELIKIHNG